MMINNTTSESIWFDCNRGCTVSVNPKTGEI